MKKLFLTLTVLGVTSLSYAAPSLEKDSNKKDSDNKNSKVENCETKRIYGCFTQTITQYENSAGEYTRSVAGPRVAGPCPADKPDGYTSTTYVHQLDPYAELWP